MKRIVLLAAAAVLLCSLLASCGKEKVPVTSGETTTEITETELKVPTADYLQLPVGGVYHLQRL